MSNITISAFNENINGLIKSVKFLRSIDPSLNVETAKSIVDGDEGYTLTDVSDDDIYKLSAMGFNVEVASEIDMWEKEQPEHDWNSRDKYFDITNLSNDPCVNCMSRGYIEACEANTGCSVKQSWGYQYIIKHYGPPASG